ncbi:hypothetical protein DL1_07670 [Thioclava dalianensis]|uniref:Aldehyde dehydrogenase domain-containing protein n=1 Tax=Thioclava dalianensis TaxID=1185766 RepID=A0A074TFR6_9RHOB|nr:hypothetical protein DL1_07670 [Thioclava dalianensis]SFN73867.1 hypothetical protein SAMN05216224_11145 [Thioclava dalianensis]
MRRRGFETTPLNLNDPSLLETRAYVNGIWEDRAARFAVHDPATGTMIAETGKPWAEARCTILYGASFIEWFSRESKRIKMLKRPVDVVGLKLGI